MIIRSLLAAGVAAGLMVSAANAVTIVNTDKTRETFVYVPKGGKAHHYSLAANHHIKLACSSGGTLMLGKSTEACTAKTTEIKIKSGKFVM